MGRCGGADTCACAVVAGDGIDVTGEGTVAAPYMVAVDGSATTALGVDDTGTVHLALTGTGTPVDPYEVTGEVPDGAVTPAQAPTLDLVGAKVRDGLLYDPATRETSVAISGDAGNILALAADGLFVGGSAALIDAADLISADAGNVLAAGADDLLYVPTPASGGVTDVWHKATVADDSPLTVTVAGMGASPYTAEVAPWLATVPPKPAVGDECYVLHPGPGTGIDDSTFLIVGYQTPRPAWVHAGVLAIGAETVTIALQGWPIGDTREATHMPSYTPVLDDTVIVIGPGGNETGSPQTYLILGSAY